MSEATELLPHHRFRGRKKPGDYRDWLARKAAKLSMIVEVGAFAGKTTRRLAEATMGTIWAVDHWRGVPDDPRQRGIYRDLEATEVRFREIMEPWISQGRVKVLKMCSLDAAEQLARELGPASLDLVFIDADHRYWPVRHDIQAWGRMLRPGGILSGHDIIWPGVRKAVRHELGVRGFRRGPGTLWWTMKGERV